MSENVRAKRKINWANIEGAKTRKRRLHLEEDEDGMYQCPVQHCDHEEFLSRRGCRKHVRSKHPWYSYFDQKPTKMLRKTHLHQKTNQSNDVASCSLETFYLPLHTLSTLVAERFVKWLCGSTGGGKPQKQAQQTANRVLRYLKFCCEDDEDELTEETIDFCLGSPVLLCRFVDAMQEELQLGPSAQLGYLNAMLELMDYRKVSGLSANVLTSFSVTEVYLKRARKTIAKKMKIKWAKDLDIDTLEEKGSWASLEELATVIPYHLPRFSSVLKNCQEETNDVLPADLTFATRFLATYLFVNVKGSRPMTYQYLTLEMIEKAQGNGGFVDQKMFKTAHMYSFDSLLLEPADMQLIEQYRQHVRPLLNPKCDYLLVTRNGTQYSKLCDLMSKQVFEAIGKHVHPTRYRQIIETESATKLDTEEQQAITEDQKHSSRVAKLHYQKKRSREVATKAQACMQKLRGESEGLQEGELQSKNFELNNDGDSDVDNNGEDITGDNDGRDGDCISDDESSLQNLTQSLPVDRSGTAKEAADIPYIESVEGRQSEEGDEEIQCTRRKKPMRFTNDEDRFLNRGLKRYGFGRWKCILKDSKLRFQEGRTADSLKKRALAKFNSKYKDAHINVEKKANTL